MLATPGDAALYDPNQSEPEPESDSESEPDVYKSGSET